MKLTLVVVALIFALCRAEEKTKVRPCNRAYKCSLQDDPAWATDGTKCYVFRNPCILGNENCQRLNRYEPALNDTSRENCETMCNPRCPRIMKPVCGYYNELKRQFSNQCEMDYYVCSTGKTYMVYNEGRCEEPLILPSN